MTDPLNYERIRALRDGHGAFRLLAADSVALIASFLYRVFIEPNRRSLPYDVVESQLADYLFHLREVYGEDIHRRSAREYLDAWTANRGFLRKYYPRQGDQPELDVTPETEKAIAFLKDLEVKPFVGTESRLQTVVSLLRELLRGAEQDPDKRIADLEERRAEIEREIAEIRSGHLKIPDGTHVKERFLQAAETAAGLLTDFRQVEDNFRQLDRDTREKIAASDAAKGLLLEEIFNEQDAIRDTDQGRSFLAFWEFLMSPDRRKELAELIERVYELEPIRELETDEFLRHIGRFLIDAGGQVYQTQSRLAEQLRKYLDDRVYLENKRMLQTIQAVEKLALALKDRSPDQTDGGVVAFLEETRPAVNLIFSRGLFVVPGKITGLDARLTIGQADVDTELLYTQNYVDEARLVEQLQKALQERGQITLSELVREFPIQQGLAEIITYFKMAHNASRARISDSEVDELTWDAAGIQKKIELPRVIFAR